MSDTNDTAESSRTERQWRGHLQLCSTWSMRSHLHFTPLAPRTGPEGYFYPAACHLSRRVLSSWQMANDYRMQAKQPVIALTHFNIIT